MFFVVEQAACCKTNGTLVLESFWAFRKEATQASQRASPSFGSLTKLQMPMHRVKSRWIAFQFEFMDSSRLRRQF